MANTGKISFSVAVLMSMNIIIGVGIFVGTQIMTARAGTLGFLGCPIAALLLFPIIWVVAQAARIFPGEGGFYHYCKEGLGESAGFLATWGYLLGYLGTAGTLITVIRDALIKEPIGLSWIAAYPMLFNIFVVMALAALNLLSIEVISKVQSGATLLKLTPLFFIVAAIIFYWNPSLMLKPSDLINVGYTVPVALFAFNGWESCCGIGHLLKGGPAQVSRVIMAAFIISAILYTIFHLSLMHIMGVENLGSLGAVAFPSFLGFAPAVTAIIQTAIAYIFLLSFVNSVYGVSLFNIANMQNLAKQKFLFGSSTLVKTNKNNRPVLIAVLHSVVVLLLITCITSTNVFIAFTNLGISIAFFMTLLSMLVVHCRRKSYSNILISLLAFSSLGLLTYYNWMSIGDDTMMRLMYAAPLVVGLGLGFAMFKIQKQRTHTASI